MEDGVNHNNGPLYHLREWESPAQAAEAAETPTRTLYDFLEEERQTHLLMMRATGPQAYARRRKLSPGTRAMFSNQRARSRALASAIHQAQVGLADHYQIPLTERTQADIRRFLTAKQLLKEDPKRGWVADPSRVLDLIDIIKFFLPS